MWSYNEISRRYTSVDVEFYVPPVVRGQADDNRQASRESDEIDQELCRRLIDEQHRKSRALYDRLLALGVCREQARGVLPQNMMTTFWGTVDLHNLISFIELRDSPHAQCEIREYARGIKQLVRPFLPNVAQALNW
jgi:thymidylate synthase (FAD)